MNDLKMNFPHSGSDQMGPAWSSNAWIYDIVLTYTYGVAAFLYWCYYNSLWINSMHFPPALRWLTLNAWIMDNKQNL